MESVSHEENDPLPTLTILYERVSRLERLVALTLLLTLLNLLICGVVALLGH